MIPGLEDITIDNVTGEALAGAELDVLRLDKIHPVISGNKWFKLKAYLEQTGQRGIATFGGAFSNHIVAAACAAQMRGVPCVGIIRGEEPPVWSDTLKEAHSYGMRLVFVSRTLYNRYKRQTDITGLDPGLADYQVIPEGGTGEPGVTGAEEILHHVPDRDKYTHIVTAVGTGTTVAGIIRAVSPNQQVLGFSSMKNNKGLHSEIEALLLRSISSNFRVVHDYHFGGYARYTNSLPEWMNWFYHMSKIPLDFVYTGKMMFGVFDWIRQGYFPAGSKILAIHSGGLQGNRSLPEGLLAY